MYGWPNHMNMNTQINTQIHNIPIPAVCFPLPSEQQKCLDQWDLWGWRRWVILPPHLCAQPYLNDDWPEDNVNGKTHKVREHRHVWMCSWSGGDRGTLQDDTLWSTSSVIYHSSGGGELFVLAIWNDSHILSESVE